MQTPEFLKRIHAHVALFHTDPERAHAFTPLGQAGAYPACLVTITGRKSGKPIETPLIYARDGDDVILVASLGGAPNNPNWYENLVANPNATVQIKKDVWNVKAQTALGAERERLWKLAAGVYPPYDDYQKKTERRIPVVVLKRV